jgi:hypothetical protein
MIYGLAEKRRTTRFPDTSLYWVIDRSDNEDREEYDGIEEPNNSWFWYFPIHLTDEEVIDKMLKKMREEIHWYMHTYDISKRMAKKYLEKGLEPEDFDRKEEYIKSDEPCGSCKSCKYSILFDDELYCGFVRVGGEEKKGPDWFCADYEKRLYDD